MGIVDTGIDLDHPEFAGRIHGAQTDVAYPGASSQDLDGHGTAVAGVIAANRDGYDTHGVAYNATLLPVAAYYYGDNFNAPGFYDIDLVRATDHARLNGARVINYSLGGGGSSPDLEGAMVRAVNAGALLVIAAGNWPDSGSPIAEPVYPASFATDTLANEQIIVVGAVDRNGNIASFSHHAGPTLEQRNVFLVAPGVDIVTTRLDGGTVTVSGTSFAAPHVSGAAALLMQAAPHLHAWEVAEILFTTAIDLGDPGVDPIYGRGLLNLDGAMQPLGATVVPTGATTAEGGAPLSATRLRLGAAFGDAMKRSEALAQAVFIDAYERTYAADLTTVIQPDRASFDLAGWLEEGPALHDSRVPVGPGAELRLRFEEAEVPSAAELAAPTDDREGVDRFGFTMALAETGWVGVSRGFGLAADTGLGKPVETFSAGAFRAPFLDYAAAGDSLVVGRNLAEGWSLSFGVADERDDDTEAARMAYVMESAHEWDGGLRFGLQLGGLKEDGSLLDGQASGALSTGNDADTRFATLFGSVPVGERLTLLASYTQGWTTADTAADSVVRGMSTIESQAFSLGVAYRGALMAGDGLTATVSRPLKVTGGTATIEAPVGRTLEGEVIYLAEEVPLRPSGNETDLELGYSMPLGEGGRLQLHGMARFEPNHIRDAGTEYVIGGKWSVAF